MKPILTVVIVFALMQSALALEISQPERIFYGTNTVPIFLRESGADAINYSIDDGAWVVGCVDCDVFNGSVEVPIGFHTLNARSLRDGVLLSGSVDFEVRLPDVDALSVLIASPRPGTHAPGKIPLLITLNQPAHALTQTLDGELTVLCQNCSKYNGSAELGIGVHELKISAWVFNQSVDKFVSLVVLDPSNPGFTFEILSPKPIVYYSETVDIAVRASTNLDRISLSTGEVLCEYCDSYDAVAVFPAGEHTMTIVGKMGFEEHEQQVTFTTTTEPFPAEQVDASAFGAKFEQLAAAVQSGAVSEAELVALFRGNKVPQDVVITLLKSGELSENVIREIIATQEKTPGFFRKILDFFGLFKAPSYAEIAYWENNLSTGLMDEISRRSDVSSKVSEEIAVRVAAVNKLQVG